MSDLEWLQSLADADNPHAQSILDRLNANVNYEEELGMENMKLRQIIHTLCKTHDIEAEWFRWHDFDTQIYEAIQNEFSDK